VPREQSLNDRSADANLGGRRTIPESGHQVSHKIMRQTVETPMNVAKWLLLALLALPFL
jgi:hypothetical protein